MVTKIKYTDLGTVRKNKDELLKGIAADINKQLVHISAETREAIKNIIGHELIRTDADEHIIADAKKFEEILSNPTETAKIAEKIRKEIHDKIITNLSGAIETTKEGAEQYEVKESIEKIKNALMHPVAPATASSPPKNPSEGHAGAAGNGKEKKEAHATEKPKEGPGHTKEHEEHAGEKDSHGKEAKKDGPEKSHAEPVNKPLTEGYDASSGEAEWNPNWSPLQNYGYGLPIATVGAGAIGLTVANAAAGGWEAPVPSLISHTTWGPATAQGITSIAATLGEACQTVAEYTKLNAALAKLGEIPFIASHLPWLASSGPAIVGIVGSVLSLYGLGRLKLWLYRKFGGTGAWKVPNNPGFIRHVYEGLVTPIDLPIRTLGWLGSKLWSGGKTGAGGLRGMIGGTFRAVRNETPKVLRSAVWGGIAAGGVALLSGGLVASSALIAGPVLGVAGYGLYRGWKWLTKGSGGAEHGNGKNEHGDGHDKEHH